MACGLVPAATARGHVAEVEQTIRSGASASSEFGHPPVLAREVAEAERPAVGTGALSAAAWQRACLPMLLLDVLAGAPGHGYDISPSLASAGLQPIKGAQRYPALVRLEDEGAILAQWEQSGSGPARKVYELTDAGRAQRQELRSQWRAFLEAEKTVSRADDREERRADHRDVGDRCRHATARILFDRPGDVKMVETGHLDLRPRPANRKDTP